jgi:hypothetical protein
LANQDGWHNREIDYVVDALSADQFLQHQEHVVVVFRKETNQDFENYVQVFAKLLEMVLKN